MKIGHLGTATAVALVLSGAQAFAATILIDDFNDVQYVSDAGTTTSTVAAPVIGGFRTLSASNSTFGSTNQNATSISSGDGLLSFSNTAGSTGSGSVTYNAGGAGLGLSASLDSTFFFDVAFFDNDANVRFNVDATDGDGRTINYMENLSEGFSPTLSFAEFTGTDGFDFGNIASLMFTVDTTGLTDNIDGALSRITLNTPDVAPIPVPAAGLLLIGGLGGLAALRRRRKA